MVETMVSANKIELINDSSLATDVVTRERPIFWV